MRYSDFVILVLFSATIPAAAQTEVILDDQQRIQRILTYTPLIDGHNDLPDQIREHYGGELSRVDLRGDTSRLAVPLHTDIARLRQGHVGAQFWSVYVPAELQGAEAAEAVHVQIDLVRQMVAQYSDVFELAQTADDILRIHNLGRIASLIGMEGGEPINNNLAILREFRSEGVLYMTLCHAKTISWIDSATDAPQHGGLSPFGESVIHEMNRIGMLADLSHVSADAMRDVLQIAEAPVIFSHSSAFAFAQHPRNVPDDVLRLVHENRGVVMVNFYPGFISEDVRQWDAVKAGEKARQTALHPGDPEAATAALAAWEASTPRPPVAVAQVADHIEHIRRIAGIDNVGLGSDFDGLPFLPEGLQGVESFPTLLAELLRRGWSDDELAKLAGGNLLRALREAEAAAQRH
jgi:membrane dipeptidase